MKIKLPVFILGGVLILSLISSCSNPILVIPPSFWDNPEQSTETYKVTYSFYDIEDAVIVDVPAGTDISEIDSPDLSIFSEESEFTGWCRNAEDTPFIGIVTEDMTLYPKWKQGYFLDVSGDEKTYRVYSEAGLKEWRNAVSSDADANCELLCDITLQDPVSEDESNWNPVDNSPGGFAGTFNGNNHWVRNVILYKTDANDTFFGFFRRIDNVAEVRNFNVECKITATATEKQHVLGSIVGSSYGKIKNCSAIVDIDAVDKYYNPGIIGGIVGQVSGEDSQVSGCYAAGTIKVQTANTGKASSVGGILGKKSAAAVEISACYFNGTINVTEEYTPGGIAGNAENGFLSALYWAGNAEKGIGSLYDSYDVIEDTITKRVDGKDITWEDAAAGMNMEMPSEYKYVVNDNPATSEYFPIVIHKIIADLGDGGSYKGVAT